MRERWVLALRRRGPLGTFLRSLLCLQRTLSLIDQGFFGKGHTDSGWVVVYIHSHPLPVWMRRRWTSMGTVYAMVGGSRATTTSTS